MKHYRSYIIFLIIVVFGLGSFALISLGYYPIVFVGRTVVTARQLRESYQVASNYSISFKKAYSDESIKEFDAKSSADQALVLNQLIENIVIDQALRQEVGKDFDALVIDKVDHYNDDLKLQEAANSLFGLDFDQFKQKVLMPQAEREVLGGRLYLKGENLGDRIQAEKKSRTIFILSGKFYWDGEKVAVKS